MENIAYNIEVETRIKDAAQKATIELDLSNLELNHLPDSIGRLTQLRALILRKNHLITLPESIATLTNLQTLDLANNQLNTLPEAIGQLTALKWLCLSDNELASLPDSIGQLTSLLTLNLSSNQLLTLPESIGQLRRLRALVLTKNRLSALPNSLGQLTELQWFYLTNNQLSTLPDSIDKLARLETLDLTSNQFPMIPSTLTKFKKIVLKNNQIPTLPESIGNFLGIESLDLANNKLTTIHSAIEKLINLQSLDLSNNRLVTLPDEVGKLTALTELNLSNNQLANMPESISQLTRLQKLDLCNNQLVTLPESMGQLTSLVALDLRYNRLATLPESLSQLTTSRKAQAKIDRNSGITEFILDKLRPLTLEGNVRAAVLRDKPPGLRDLYVEGNTLLRLPAEMLSRAPLQTRNALLGENPETILDYYFRSRQGRPLNEAKLILVGRGGVGKTSIVKRLVYDTFDTHEKKTDGIQITDWNFMLHGKESVRLNVWDFGGQEIMHATHQLFFTTRSVYILVLSGREGGEDSDANYWLSLIESFGGNSPVIVVLNKINEQRFDVNRRALEQKYVGIREFVGTDCEDGTGIIDLNGAIERETDRLADLRVQFPASWIAIKDRLAGMSKYGENFLDLDTYRKECSRLGETNPDAQDKLANYLHSLGIALNFSDDSRLRDTHVLNPHWVTNGIYRILNAPILAYQKGIIGLDDLRDILDHTTYPIRMHGFLLDLMRKFELCFPLGENLIDKFLFPQLLDKQEPQETCEFVSSECLNFEYHYPLLPEGLIPRFIVRTYAMSKDLFRWRSGVILKFEDNRAVVRGDSSARKVAVAVNGPLLGRRNLLAIIRADLESIHSYFPTLDPKPMVPLPEHPDVVIEYDELLKFEQDGWTECPKRVGNNIVKLDIRALLNGVDVAVRSKSPAMWRRTGDGVRVFISYAHKDEMFRAELDAHLKLLQRVGLIQKWDDRLIKPSEEWKHNIDENLERADIILLLVSADFLDSDFCWEMEMERALERHDAGDARVIPVIIRDSNWQEAKFAKLQALPKDGVAVTHWQDRDSAWRNVADGIKKIAQEIQLRRKKQEREAKE